MPHHLEHVRTHDDHSSICLSLAVKGRGHPNPEEATREQPVPIRDHTALRPISIWAGPFSVHDHTGTCQQQLWILPVDELTLGNRAQFLEQLAHHLFSDAAEA